MLECVVDGCPCRSPHCLASHRCEREPTNRQSRASETGGRKNRSLSVCKRHSRRDFDRQLWKRDARIRYVTLELQSAPAHTNSPASRLPFPYDALPTTLLRTNGGTAYTGRVGDGTVGAAMPEKGKKGATRNERCKGGAKREVMSGVLVLIPCQ